MRFDIYGRYQLEVTRDGDAWTVRRLDNGRRRSVPGLIVPSSIRPEEIVTYLDDMLHEMAAPGTQIRRLD